MKIELSRPFAANGKVDEFDIKQMKKALNRLGYYQPYEKVGITGIADTGVFDALKAFQKDRGLTANGSAKPDDETIRALNKETSKTPEGQYIWRTVEDDKVRKGHAEFNRTIRDWSDNPDPGEEFNCRCWAEPVKGEAEGLKQEVISPLEQSSYKWTDEDFKKHFWRGKGREVTLPEVGWLVDIIWHAKQIMFHKVEKQIENKAREVQSGKFSDTWERSYDFEEIVFSIGNAVIKGRFNGTVKKDGNILRIDAIVYYLLDDEFTDPWNIRQTAFGNSDPDILWDNPIGDVTLVTTDLFLGTRYPITGTWTTKITGSIKSTD